MLRKKCIAFLCAVVLLAAVLVAPVSAASTTGTCRGEVGSLNTTADLRVRRTAADASTGPQVSPSPNPYTTVTIRCYSGVTGGPISVSNSGAYGVYAYCPDSTYYITGTVTSSHSLDSIEWGRWYTALSEVADF